MRTQATPRRRVWPFIVAGIVIIIVAIAVANTLRDAGVTPTATPTSASTPSASSSPASDAEPTGCLGGTSRDAAMLQTAASQAGSSESGAVELAASFVRWIQRYPYPTAAEAAEVQKGVLANQSFTSDLVAYLSAEPDLSGGIVPAGTTYYMSTLPGVWHVESSTSDKVVVSIGTGYVIDGALSSTLRSSITVTLTKQGEKWLVADANGTRTPADLYQVGQIFSGGC
ncbi:MAG: hypothetical protein ACOH10_00155 [Rhodoglobus sp.]